MATCYPGVILLHELPGLYIVYISGYGNNSDFSILPNPLISLQTFVKYILKIFHGEWITFTLGNSI